MSNALLRRIRRAESELERARKNLAALRRRVPDEEVRDYRLIGGKGAVRLSSLFGKHRDLVLVHNMGAKCPYCTLWADGFEGIRKPLEDRAAFVVCSPDPPAVQRKFARSRGWEFRMVSDADSFTLDMGYRTRDGMRVPGVSTFHRDGRGRLFRTGRDVFGPGDLYCSLWHFLDLLKDGPKGWEPKFRY